MKPSTRVVLRKHGLRIDRFVHHYLYFVFYQPYMKVALSAIQLMAKVPWFKPLNPVIDALYQRFHAKVLVPEDTRKMLQLKEDLCAVSERNRRIIPFKYAYKIIFEEPESIAVMDCPCRKVMPPHEDIRCCIAVGRDLSSFWLEHCEKYHVRKITQAEALDIVEGYRRTGHITQAFFRVATGGSTGVICSCHPASCVSLQATAVTRKFRKAFSMSASSGYSVAIDAARCNACGACLQHCHTDALTIPGKTLRYDTDLCLGCGLCVELCDREALSLFLDETKPQPLDVDRVRTSLASGCRGGVPARSQRPTPHS